VTRAIPALVAAAMLLAPGAGRAAAQAADACTYDTCALRVERRAIVGGVEGRVVTPIGYFRTDVGRVPWQSDPARRYARLFARDYTPGRLLYVLGTVAYTVGVFEGYRREEGFTGWPLAAVIGGVGVGVYGSYRLRRADDALSRAIWWHNRELPKGGAP